MELQENKLMTKTFFWMFIGLLSTAIISWYTYSSGLFINILRNEYFNILLITELIVVWLFSFCFKKMSPMFVAILFFIYSMLNGVLLSTIFAVFELNSVIQLFLVSALLFGAFALIGFFTKQDLSSWNYILFGALIAGIILSLINIFLGSSILDILLDWFMIFVFFGITIYDVNNIKALQYDSSLNQEKLYIYGAMQLYLDFINIFLRILSIFGKRRN